jgi:hypothetical protein
MLFNSNTTAITKYRGATQKADHSIKRLEGTLLVCFVCSEEGDGKPQSFTLYKCCGQHHVCQVHHNKKERVTKLVEVRGGHTALKCAHPCCKADALWPAERLDKSACTMNQQVYDTLIDVKDAAQATKDFEKECDKERATVLNRADARVAAAETARQQAEAIAAAAQAEAAAATAAAAAAAAAAPAAAAPSRKYKRKAEVIAEDGPEAWEEMQSAKKARAAERKEEAELNRHNGKLAQILPPLCVRLMGQSAYEEYLSEHLAPPAPAPADAGSSSAAGREAREECDECDDDEM